MTSDAPQKARVFTRSFVILACVNFFMFFAFQMLNVGMPVYVASLGANSVLVGLSTTLVTIMALAIRPFSGIILDRFGRKGILVLGTILIICATITYAIFPIVGVILGFRLLHGVGWGLGSTASSTIAADIIPRERFAEGMGYFAMTNSISSALAPALAVHLTQGGNAQMMLFVAIGMTLVSLLFAFFIKEQATRKLTKVPAAEAAGTAESKTQDPGNESAAPSSPATPPQSPKGLAAFFERRAVFPACIMALVNIAFASITTFIALHAAEQGVNGASLYFIVYAVATIITRPMIGKIIDTHGFFWPGVFSTLCPFLMYSKRSILNSFKPRSVMLGPAFTSSRSMTELALRISLSWRLR